MGLSSPSGGSIQPLLAQLLLLEREGYPGEPPHCSSDLFSTRPPDPYVKVWLMYKDKRVEKKKTVTMKRNLNPIFNESFAFDIPTEKLRETTIIITVMDKDKLSRNDVIGKVGAWWVG